MIDSNRVFVTSDIGVIAALSMNGIRSESFDFNDRNVCTFHYDAENVRDIVARYHSGALMVAASAFQATVRDIAKWIRTQKARQ